MQAFYVPVRMFTGENAVKDHLASQLQGRSCLIVTGGSSAKKCGALSDILEVLKKNRIRYAIFDGIRENPTVESCRQAGILAAEQQLEVVLGAGGGSPMDAAKAAAVFAANPEMAEADFYSGSWVNPPKPILLVGTTAGTGSEVTKVAVLTDSAGKKHSMHHDSLYAAAAFGDPRYTATMAPAVTLSTAVDVLAHCCESFFAKGANAYSRSAAAEGIRLLAEPLSRAENGENLTMADRAALYNASILGGLAIAVTGTCFPHNVGYYLTETRQIPHGFASAVFLPRLLSFVKGRAPELFTAFLTMTGLEEDKLLRLVPGALPDLRIAMTPEEITAALPRWENNSSVRKTIGDPTMEDIRAMLTELSV